MTTDSGEAPPEPEFISIIDAHMKKILFWNIIALIISSLFASSAALAQDANAIVNANNQFALDLYSKYKSNAGNVFYSPYSITSALAMTYEGARGKTAEEMQAVFHFPEDADIRQNAYRQFYQQINKKDKKYKLTTANALWAQKDYNFLDTYFSLVEQYYAGRATNLDFSGHPEDCRLTINKWVEGQTYEKIKDLIPDGLITPLTTLVLTNAIYFKGFWLKQFDKNNTHEEDFRVSPDSTVKAAMMRLTGEDAKFNYAETDELQILELPYEGEELSMLVLLPKADNLDAVEKSLTLEKVSAWKKLLDNTRVDVYLPKFKFETKYLMGKDLAVMGMPAAFSRNADFSGMTGKKDLFISEVIHQAFVEVSEEGTEAAAATAVVMLEMVSMPKETKIFRADHPFIFIIQENRAGNILFIGRVTDPTE